MYRLITNKIRCKFCGDIIQSRSVHDFRQCTCHKCFTDGGLEYVRRGFDGDDPQKIFEDLSEYVEVETGRIVAAKDMKPEDIPTASDKIQDVSAEVIAEVDIPVPVLEIEEKEQKEPTPVPTLDEVTEAEAEPEKLPDEGKVTETDKKGKPVAGRYPYNRK